MLLFLMIGVCAAIGIRIGMVKDNKMLLRSSLIALLVDIALFIIGSILYAMYE